MGLLDDAIREHLELKRQRGAEADEVARLEREALGPVVRGDELAAQADPAGAASFSSEYDGVEPVHDLEHEQPHEPAPTEHLTAADPLPEPVEFHEPLPVAEPEHPPAPAAEPAVEPLPELPFEHADPPPPPPPVADEHGDLPQHAGQPTMEFDVEAAHAHEPPPPPAEPPPPPAAEHDAAEQNPPHPPAPGEHDVLEETPEFLQETPEHDRLWFEQAPPQEFDFDK